MKQRLRTLAHARTGDKGDTSFISLTVYCRSNFSIIDRQVTEEAVMLQFIGLRSNRVERYALPLLGALNFALHGVLYGGVTRSLALDAHGKTLAFTLLEMEVYISS